MALPASKVTVVASDALEKRPPSIIISLATLPILPSVVNRTSPPLTLISPVKVLAALVISNLPSVFTLAAKVSPPDVFEITPLNVFVPLFPCVNVLTAPPKETLFAKLKFVALPAIETTVANSPN